MLGLLTLVLTVWAFWPGLEHTPRLGLDLRGGTQVILQPRPVQADAQITDDQLNQAVNIIRARVDGLGVAESDVSLQGSGNNAAIVVSIPGVNEDRIVELVGRTALLDFRPVEDILDPAAVSASASPSASATPSGSAPAATASPAPSPAASTTPAPAASTTPAPAASPSPSASAGSDAPTIVQSASNDAAFQQRLGELNCTDPRVYAGGSPDDPALWLGTCMKDGSAKFNLQPAFIRGTNVTDASAGIAQGGAGWQVNLSFDSEGAAKLAEVSGKLVGLPSPQNQFAIVLDGVVQSAPYFSSQIIGGQAQITGSFTAQEAQDLAQILKYGALPVTLDVASVENVTPTIGDDQLKGGIIAGILGLILVAAYLLLYYRALGTVAVLSLVVAAWLTYVLFVILGRTVGFTLTLAGVAGAIVAIGITADSFVVYFERIRDEIRDGRTLRQAVDTGWERAKRTILAADFVSLLAAVVLYVVSVGSVRGFAFTLGLTTLIDIAVAFLFSRPLVVVFSRSRWMQRGGPWTGLSPQRLGVAAKSPPGSRRSPAAQVVDAQQHEATAAAAVAAGATDEGDENR